MNSKEELHREKRFSIVIGRDESGSLAQVSLFEFATDQLLKDFESIGEAIQYCLAAEGGFDFQEDYDDSEEFDPDFRIKITPDTNTITISEDNHDYWFGDLSDIDAAIEELFRRDCDWDLVFYDSLKDEDEDEDENEDGDGAVNPSFKSTRKLFRKLALLWELARNEGYEDSIDDDGISLEMFVSAQLAILALKGIYNPSDDHIKAIRRATKEFDELLDSPKVSITRLDLESTQTFQSTENEHFRFSNGRWHVRTKRYGEDVESNAVKSKLESLLSEKTKIDEQAELFVELAPAITNLLWQDYAKLGHVFYCNHYSQPYEDDFGILDFRYEESDYYIREIGTPSWVEVYIDWVDLSIDRESNWNEWGEGFLENIDSSGSLLLLYAWDTTISDDYLTEAAGDWYWPKVDVNQEIDGEIRILQSDPRWYFDADYFNIIEFGATPDLDHISYIERECRISYDALSNNQISKLVDIAINMLEHPDIGSNKVVHYILSLILNHPKTPEETRAFIAVISDPCIRQFNAS